MFCSDIVEIRVCLLLVQLQLQQLPSKVKPGGGVGMSWWIDFGSVTFVLMLRDLRDSWREHTMEVKSEAPF